MNLISHLWNSKHVQMVVMVNKMENQSSLIHYIDLSCNSSDDYIAESYETNSSLLHNEESHAEITDVSINLISTNSNHASMFEVEPDLEKRLKIEAARKEHEKLYESSYNEKRRDNEKARASDKVITLSLDLKKCLPKPYLTAGFSFHKRQLWTVN
ncbi:unnamed protein product [Parnassius apollo]|uniref:(apollo) hypothetical protein n=1 Tax=Parnassius apollo TaxID=110799 RepID=A0A8S3WKR5_PARAO|nr:unnamed protein product [Parnassius apollo]